MTTAYDQYMKLALERYSCRSYDAGRAVSDEDVRAVIEAARIAPSACNRQPWKFIVVRDAGRRRALLSKSRPVFVDAPVLIACVGLHDQVWVRPSDSKDHTDVDVAIAVQQMCLAATALGLGTCWICSFDTEAARMQLQLPEGAEPIALLPLGWPAANTVVTAKNRKPLDEICSCEVFGQNCTL